MHRTPDIKASIQMQRLFFLSWMFVCSGHTKNGRTSWWTYRCGWLSVPSNVNTIKTVCYWLLLGQVRHVPLEILPYWPLGDAHLSPFSCCHVWQTVSVAAASASGRFGPPAGLVSRPPIGPCRQELLTVDLSQLNTPSTGLGALEEASRRRR